MNVHKIARANTAWMRHPPASRATGFTVIAILCGVIVSIGLVYGLASVIAMLLQ